MLRENALTLHTLELPGLSGPTFVGICKPQHLGLDIQVLTSERPSVQHQIEFQILAEGLPKTDIILPATGF